MTVIINSDEVCPKDTKDMWYQDSSSISACDKKEEWRLMSNRYET
jgi:hypothetical protein